MIMTYEIEDNLYVNLTNRCPNACRFCIRNKPEAFAHDLWLDQEPSAGEVIREILARELSQYRQLVFCGFGEPLERLEEVLEIVRRVKEKTKSMSGSTRTGWLAKSTAGMSLPNSRR